MASQKKALLLKHLVLLCHSITNTEKIAWDLFVVGQITILPARVMYQGSKYDCNLIMLINVLCQTDDAFDTLYLSLKKREPLLSWYLYDPTTYKKLYSKFIDSMQ